MIQELFGMVEESKISIPGGVLDVSSSSSATLSPATSMSSPSSSSEPQQSLRCPRCDSSNTKFCYYNNYNLTQPRHFCKTCRRYWTKGGALRNVPIGGGCRKARPSLPLTAAGRLGGGKAKPTSPDVAARLGLEQELPLSPAMWATPYSSQLLNLLRTSQFQNPNPNPNSHVVAETAGVVGEQSLCLDPFSQIGNSLWGNRGGHLPYHHQQPPPQLQQQQQHNVLMGEVQNPGIQELLQRLRSSANYDGHHLPAVISNVGSTAACSSSLATAGMATSTSASILEPLPLAGGDFGYWNPAFSWADLPATNGAFP